MVADMGNKRGIKQWYLFFARGAVIGLKLLAEPQCLPSCRFNRMSSRRLLPKLPASLSVLPEVQEVTKMRRLARQGGRS